MKKMNQSGQGLVEYLVLVCLITMSSIAVVSVVGTNIKELYANVAHTLQGKKKINFTEVEPHMVKSRTLDDFMEGASKPKSSPQASWNP